MTALTTHLQWQLGSDEAESQFFADGMRCANCANAIRSGVSRLPGVEQVDVNLATARVNVRWHPSAISLERVIDEVGRLGFKPIPLSGEAAVAARRVEQRQALKRIGLAGLGAMQMSMYTVGLYAGALSGIDADLSELLRVTSMLITIPVLFYSGAPLLKGAWSDVRRRSLGMDVPVAVALLLAFAASVYNTLRNSGQIYYDSVAMFIFFLLIGRYVEAHVRRGSLDASEALARSLPAQVTRLATNGSSTRVPLQEVRRGDRLLIARGAVVPVDATLEDAAAVLDEALISGESVPVNHAAGARLLGGSVNVGVPITVLACSSAADSTLVSMMALINRAQSQRPRASLLADRAAKYFVLSILLLSIVVAALWLWIDPSRAFEATIAVLVVTCPCALSLATPAAVAAATARLAKRGVLVTQPNALERLAQVDTVMLDKTGTLTSSDVQICDVQILAPHQRSDCLSVAAALERASNHPLASAFSEIDTAGIVVTEMREVAGSGLEGRINGQLWRIGQRAFVAQLPASDDERLWLGSDTGMVASFELRSVLRSDAVAAVAALRARGLDLVIASGDSQRAVDSVAQTLGITKAHGRLDPTAKLALLQHLQQQGRRVLMLGDGINDGPVLAAAHVSCAMGRGAAIAQSAADLLLMNESLQSVGEAVQTARDNGSLVRANLRWALIYNLCAVPLAAIGLVPPWLAAIGMSASSLYVVLRAQRFSRIST